MSQEDHIAAAVEDIVRSHNKALQKAVARARAEARRQALEEAAEIAARCRVERFAARDRAAASKSPRTARDHESMAIQAAHIEVAIRAKIGEPKP